MRYTVYYKDGGTDTFEGIDDIRANDTSVELLAANQIKIWLPLAVVKYVQALPVDVGPRVAPVVPGLPPTIDDDRFTTLPKRQAEVVQLMMQQKTNVEMAALMNVHPKTIDNFITQIVQRTGFANRKALRNWCRDNGILADVVTPE